MRAFKLTKLILIFMLFSLHVNCQEICNNAIDDDADGLIDLNDPDCDCNGVILDQQNILPNPSFEQNTCCVAGKYRINEQPCIAGWTSISDNSFATSDWYSPCGMKAGNRRVWNAATSSYNYYPEPPVRSTGNSFVGFLNYQSGGGSNVFEYVGTKDLLTTLCAGIDYELTVNLVSLGGTHQLDFSVFGVEDTSDYYFDSGCPVGNGSWQLLGSKMLNLNTDTTWGEYTLTFTPTNDICGIALGGSCSAGAGTNLYYYMDDVSIKLKNGPMPMHKVNVSSTGDLCSKNLILDSETEKTGCYENNFDIQWYKDDIALVGEVGSTLNVSAGNYGEGIYRARYVDKLTGDCYSETISFQGMIATGTDIQIACGSYTWINGVAYLASNSTATDTLVGGSYTGCDSIVTLV